MKIVLYGRPYNRTDRVQWTLEELALPYEYRKLDVFGLEHRKPEFRKKYGLARLPFVELDGEVMFESGAIMVFLAQRFDANVDLLLAGDDSAHRQVLQWLFFAISTLESAQEHLESGADPAPFAPQIDTLAFLEDRLKGREYIAAEKFSLADIAVANGLKWLNRQSLANFPNVSAYFVRQTRRAAYKKITAQPEYPEHAPGAEPGVRDKRL